MKRLTLIGITLLLGGCASMTREGTLISQASYLEKCPVEKIKVLSISPDHVHAEADVCGVVHRYQDQATYVGVDHDPRWLDIGPR